PLLSASFPVAYALGGLQAIKAGSTVAANTVCTTIDTTTPQFTINFAEGFAKAFKTVNEESGTNVNAKADNGTRLAITFTNVPANVTVYVPTSVQSNTSSGLGVLTNIISATAATPTDTSNNTKAAGTTSPLNALVAVTITGGTGTTYYELTNPSDAGIAENFPVAVTFASKAGSVASQTAAIQAAVSFA